MERWGKWGTVGAGRSEAFPSAEEAQSALRDLIAQRRRLGYEDDHTEEEATIREISLGPSRRFRQNIYQTQDPPEPVRRLGERRSICAFAVHPNAIRVLVALWTEIIEFSLEDGSKKTIAQLPNKEVPSALTWITPHRFALGFSRRVQIYDESGRVECEVRSGGDQLVSVRGGEILASNVARDEWTTTKVWALREEPPRLELIGEIDVKWRELKIALYDGEIYFGAGNSGQPILYVDENYERLVHPPPPFPPGLVIEPPE